MNLSRRLGVSSGVVVSVLLLGLAVPAAGQTRVSTIQEVIEGWSPEKHLWVIGDVGLPEATLAELEAWLAGRHWTVLLVRDAEGQSFRDGDGVLRGGESAIEYGTGQGITRAPGFAGQVHPDTREPDGAILSILLAQRALYYSGSWAQDSRGLGEEAFQGNLDQWAVSALRNGQDIVSAVRDTVTGVDARLAEVVAAERNRAVMEVIAARQEIEQAAETIGYLEWKAKALRSSPHHPSEGLANPDTASLVSHLEKAREMMETHPGEASRIADEVTLWAQNLMGPIDLYPSAAGTLDDLRNRLGQVERHEHAAAAREEIGHAGRVLAAAGDLYRRADPGYAEQIDLAQGAVANAEFAAEQDRQRAFQRSSFITLLVLGWLGAMGWLGLLLNRRRRPVKEEAEALLDSWQTALDRKLEALFGELERRVERLVGPVSDRFVGETGDLARQVRSDVGSLTILWTSARAVLEQARERIRPRRLGPILYNFFSPANYVRGLALLKDEPVPFDPAEGLPRLFGGERTWRDDLLGDLAAYEPFRKSFEDLMAEFHTRAARAAGALDEIEAALRELPLLVEKAGERIWQTGLQKEYLAEGAGDGLFLVPAVFSRVLPAAEAALEEARGTASSDPVGTWKGSGALAERLAADAWRLAGLCRGARSAVMPGVQPAEIRLRETGFATAWIGEGLRALSERAAGLASRAAEEAVSAEIETLAVDLAAFQELTGGVAGMRSRIVAEERRVESSRAEIGAALGLAPDLLLRETGSDPSERLAAAALHASETEARLGRGEVQPAAEALESADRLAAEAEAIVDASRKTFEERETAVAARRAETERLAALLPEHELVLDATLEAYAESALGPAWDNVDETRQEIAAARGKLDLAEAGLREGRMLAAASLLGEVRFHQEQAGSRLAEIKDTRARLDRAREENRGLLPELEARASSLGADLSGDPRITKPTLSAFEEAAARVRTVRQWIDAGREDPLKAGQELVAAREGLDRTAVLAPEDRRLHGEAERQIEEAGGKVGEATGWSGSYGVFILGQPGVAALQNARDLLEQQRYAEARESALAAWTEAESALAEARAEEARRRAEERRREEERRRREEEARRRSSSDDSSSSSSSSFSSRSSGSSGSSGSSSSSSGSSRSSYGGSSSGSGRSKW